MIITTGNITFGSFGSNASIGSDPDGWGTPAGVQYDDGTANKATISLTGVSKYLYAVNPIAGLPAFADSGLINGIDLRYIAEGSGREDNLQVFENNAPVGNNGSLESTWLTGNFTTWFIRGGVSDLWGLTTQKSIPGWRTKKSGFGFGVGAYFGGSNGFNNVFVMNMRLTYQPSLFYAF